MLVISLNLSCLVLASLKTRHGRNIISFYFFLFITGRAKCTVRAACGVTHVTVAALFCSSSLLCISNSDWATENEAGWSVSVNRNEEPAGEICHQYSSVVTAIIPYARTIKLKHTLIGDYRECVWPARLPVLTWVSSSVPPGNNIQDTFPAGSATDTTTNHLYFKIQVKTLLSDIAFKIYIKTAISTLVNPY